MRSFTVTVTEFSGVTHRYTALAAHSFDAWDSAVSRFGLCKVQVTAIH